MIRPISKVHTTPHFEHSFRNLPKNVHEQAIVRDQWFRINAFDPRLKTHSLKGKLKGLWAYSVDRRHRILFEFLHHDEVLLHDIGIHSIYKR